MPDPALLTGIIGAAAGVSGAAIPVIIERHNRRKSAQDELEEAAEESVTSWTSLNEALGREIRRLQGEIDRIRSENQAALARQQIDYENQLTAARRRITELETDVASLRRILGQPPN